MSWRAPPRGAGRGGGLLFVALLLFLAYLVGASLEGVTGLVLAALPAAAAGMLFLRVVRRG